MAGFFLILAQVLIPKAILLLQETGYKYTVSTPVTIIGRVPVSSTELIEQT